MSTTPQEPVQTVVMSKDSFPSLYGHGLQKALCEKLWELRSNSTFCDVHFYIRNEVIPAHCLVLAASSPVLCKAFAEADWEPGPTPLKLRLNFISYQECLTVLEYMYTGTVTIKESSQFKDFFSFAQNFENLLAKYWPKSRFTSSKEVLAQQKIFQNVVINISESELSPSISFTTNTTESNTNQSKSQKPHGSSATKTPASKAIQGKSQIPYIITSAARTEKTSDSSTNQGKSQSPTESNSIAKTSATDAYQVKSQAPNVTSKAKRTGDSNTAQGKSESMPAKKSTPRTPEIYTIQSKPSASTSSQSIPQASYIITSSARREKASDDNVNQGTINLPPVITSPVRMSSSHIKSSLSSDKDSQGKSKEPIVVTPTPRNSVSNTNQDKPQTPYVLTSTVRTEKTSEKNPTEARSNRPKILTSLLSTAGTPITNPARFQAPSNITPTVRFSDSVINQGKSTVNISASGINQNISQASSVASSSTRASDKSISQGKFTVSISASGTNQNISQASCVVSSSTRADKSISQGKSSVNISASGINQNISQASCVVSSNTKTSDTSISQDKLQDKTSSVKASGSGTSQDKSQKPYVVMSSGRTPRTSSNDTNQSKSKESYAKTHTLGMYESSTSQGKSQTAYIESLLQRNLDSDTIEEQSKEPTEVSSQPSGHYDSLAQREQIRKAVTRLRLNLKGLETTRKQTPVKAHTKKSAKAKKLEEESSKAVKKVKAPRVTKAKRATVAKFSRQKKKIMKNKKTIKPKKKPRRIKKPKPIDKIQEDIPAEEMQTLEKTSSGERRSKISAKRNLKGYVNALSRYRRVKKKALEKVNNKEQSEGLSTNCTSQSLPEHTFHIEPVIGTLHFIKTEDDLQYMSDEQTPHDGAILDDRPESPTYQDISAHQHSYTRMSTNQQTSTAKDSTSVLSTIIATRAPAKNASQSSLDQNITHVSPSILTTQNVTNNTPVKLATRAPPKGMTNTVPYVDAVHAPSQDILQEFQIKEEVEDTVSAGAVLTDEPPVRAEFPAKNADQTSLSANDNKNQTAQPAKPPPRLKVVKYCKEKSKYVIEYEDEQSKDSSPSQDDVSDEYVTPPFVSLPSEIVDDHSYCNPQMPTCVAVREGLAPNVPESPINSEGLGTIREDLPTYAQEQFFTESIQKQKEAQKRKARNERRRELAKQRKIDMMGDEDLTCPLCKKIFLTQKSLTIHRNYTHDKEENLYCEVCKLRFRSRNLFLAHNVEKHYKEGMEEPIMYKCKFAQCSYTTYRQKMLHYHHKFRHWKDQGNSSTICDICGKTLLHTKSLATHMELRHGAKQQPAKCPYCDKTFQSTICLRKHFETNHLEGRMRLDCDLCSYTTMDPATMDLHLYRYHSVIPDGKSGFHIIEVLTTEKKEYVCEKCGISCSSKALKAGHKCQKMFECDLCKLRFETKSRLNTHRKAPCSEDTMDDYECFICNMRFPTIKSVEAHMKTLHVTADQKFICNLCDKTFDTTVQLKLHIRLHNADMVKCPYCTYMTKLPLDPHLNAKHADKRILCEKCPFTAFFEAEMNLHYFKIHTELKPIKVVTGAKRCPYCDFTTNGPIYPHLVAMHQDKRMTCEICRAYTCYKPISMNLHMYQQHNKELGKRVIIPPSLLPPSLMSQPPSLMPPSSQPPSLMPPLSQPPSLIPPTPQLRSLLPPLQQLPVSSLKEKKKKVVCEYCGKLILKGEHFRKHVRRHKLCLDKPQLRRNSLQKRERFFRNKTVIRCKWCGRCYPGKIPESHKRRHAEDPLFGKEKECYLCEFTSATKTGLNSHMTTHNTEEFKCDLCQTVIIGYTNYKKHKRRHTKEGAEVQWSFQCRICSFVGTSKIGMCVHLNKHRVVNSCQYCDFKTKMPGRLKRHILKEHGGKNFCCQLCSYACHLSQDLAKHRFTKHPNVRQKRFKPAATVNSISSQGCSNNGRAVSQTFVAGRSLLRNKQGNEMPLRSSVMSVQGFSNNARTASSTAATASSVPATSSHGSSHVDTTVSRSTSIYRIIQRPTSSTKNKLADTGFGQVRVRDGVEWTYTPRGRAKLSSLSQNEVEDIRREKLRVDNMESGNKSKPDVQCDDEMQAAVNQVIYETIGFSNQ